ncbi:hypothetical protein BN2127_JRS10_01951 [Bacillus subtilis]|nr:hypothetical protein BN2127_JRS10_01951 [Bacillus subtilis]
MLKNRDRKIVDCLNQFRCMTRDQVAAIFFNDVKKPITSVNFVLKRLRKRGYIEVDSSKQPYIYFSKENIIKKSSQKVPHYLAIVDFFIDACKYEKPTIFEVEHRYGKGFMQPDIFMIWRKRAFFVEIQKSRYSSRLMKNKLSRYINYLKSEKWLCKTSPYQILEFPFVWIISKSAYTISDSIIKESLNIIQTPTVEAFFAIERCTT